MPRTSRLLSWIVGALSMGAGACNTGIPTPTFPQLQAVGEVGEYGTERVTASDGCRKSATSIDVYLACMTDKGWEFIPRDTTYPAPECWSLRTAGDPRQLPTGQCFRRARSAPPAPVAPVAAP